MWNLVSLRLEEVLVSVQDWCTVCAKRTIGSEMFWTQSMVLLGDEAQLKARIGLFGDSGNIDARWVHGLCRTFHRLGNHFGRTRWNS